VNIRAAIILVLALVLDASAQQPPKRILSSELGGRDLTFLNRANEQDLVLMALAEVGKSKGSSEAVRVLADLIGTTQEKEHEQLLALARSKGVSVSASAPGSLKRLHTLLDPLKKEAFDKAWLGEIADLLKTSVQNFAAGSASGDPDIKKLASSGLSLAEDKLGAVSKVAGR
jgi:predicted outer membrane protein